MASQISAVLFMSLSKLEPLCIFSVVSAFDILSLRIMHKFATSSQVQKAVVFVLSRSKFYLAFFRIFLPILAWKSSGRKTI